MLQRRLENGIVLWFLFVFLLVIRFIFKNSLVPRNLIDEYPKCGIENAYEDCDPVFLNDRPRHLCFDSCSVLSPVTLEHRLLWNFICERAFHYAATSQPRDIFPREVGLKLTVGSLTVHIPVWKFRLCNFLKLCQVWTNKLNIDPSLGEYGIINCVSVLGQALLLCEERKKPGHLIEKLWHLHILKKPYEAKRTYTKPLNVRQSLQEALLDLLQHPDELRNVQIYEIFANK